MHRRFFFALHPVGQTSVTTIVNEVICLIQSGPYNSGHSFGEQ